MDRRQAYLEFLRNLSPQALIIAFAIILLTRLGTDCCYWTERSIKGTFLVFYLSALWMVAIYANCTLFMERYLESSSTLINEESARLKAGGMRGWAYLTALARFAKDRTPMVFWEAIAALTLVQGGIVIVALSALRSAENYYGVKHLL